MQLRRGCLGTAKLSEEIVGACSATHEVSFVSKFTRRMDLCRQLITVSDCHCFSTLGASLLQWIVSPSVWASGQQLWITNLCGIVLDSLETCSAQMCLAVDALVYSPLWTSPAQLTVPLQHGAVRFDESKGVAAAHRHSQCRPRLSLRNTLSSRDRGCGDGGDRVSCPAQQTGYLCQKCRRRMES